MPSFEHAPFLRPRPQDQMIVTLKEQVSAAQMRIEHTEAMLDRQRQELLQQFQV